MIEIAAGLRAQEKIRGMCQRLVFYHLESVSPSALRQVTKSGRKLGPSTRVRIADQHLLSHNTLNDSEDTKYDERLTKAPTMDAIDDDNVWRNSFLPTSERGHTTEKRTRYCSYRNTIRKLGILPRSVDIACHYFGQKLYQNLQYFNAIITSKTTRRRWYTCDTSQGIPLISN